MATDETPRVMSDRVRRARKWARKHDIDLPRADEAEEVVEIDARLDRLREEREDLAERIEELPEEPEAQATETPDGEVNVEVTNRAEIGEREDLAAKLTALEELIDEVQDDRRKLIEQAREEVYEAARRAYRRHVVERMLEARQIVEEAFDANMAIPRKMKENLALDGRDERWIRRMRRLRVDVSWQQIANLLQSFEELMIDSLHGEDTGDDP